MLSGRLHPRYRHGDTASGSRTKEWRAWNAMIRRCTYPSMDRFPRYGGRGIRICSEWRASYEAYLRDVGRAPSSAHQIDRINNDGNYEPGNVRWATRSEQIRNSAKARPLTLNGETHLIGEWAARVGINRQTIQMRLDRYGWPIERALATPVQRGKRREVRDRNW